MAKINLTINGEARTFDGDPETPLLWVLRDHFNLVGTKFGCGIGACVACTVHLDNVARRSCSTPIATVANRRITTIEGLSRDGRHPAQLAWDEIDVPQCGYCQTGQIMQAAALLAHTPAPTDQQEQAPPAVVVVLVLLEVLGEVADPAGQHRDLDLRRAGVRLVLPERLRGLLLRFLGEGHATSS